MKPTPQQETALRALSEGKLYDAAEHLAGQHRGIKQDQLQGLLTFSRRWGDLEKFVAHQKERTWSDRSPYPSFYGALETELKQIYANTQAKFVPEGLPKSETREQTEFFVSRTTSEFILHLVAEMVRLQEGNRR